MMRADKLIFIILILLIAVSSEAAISGYYVREIKTDYYFGYPVVTLMFKSTNDMDSCGIILKENEKFVRSFGRGFIKMNRGLFEYLHCFVTNHRRIWLYSTTGKIVETGPDEEIYL